MDRHQLHLVFVGGRVGVGVEGYLLEVGVERSVVVVITRELELAHRPDELGDILEPVLPLVHAVVVGQPAVVQYAVGELGDGHRRGEAPYVVDELDERACLRAVERRRVDCLAERRHERLA